MEIQTVEIKDLKEAKYNPNEADEETLQGLQASIKKFGYIEPIVWNKRSGNIVGGHQRVKTLKKLGEKKLKVSVVDLSPVEEKTLNLTLNNPHIRGQMNPEKLKLVLDEIKIEIEEFEDLKLDDLEISVEEIEIVEDEPPEIKEKEISKTGDLWVLGDHRLLCGDSTQKEDVEKLLALSSPILMVTDPPYGVNYDPEWRKGIGLGLGERSTGRVKNDDIVDWSVIYSKWNAVVLYVWCSGRFFDVVLVGLKRERYEMVSQIIWVKQHFVLSRGDYHWKHEPCVYAVKKGEDHNWQGARDQSTVWEIKNNNIFGGAKEEKFGHATQKPVECMSRPIRNNSKIGDSVCDPFGGTGTTIIAAEQLDRKCFMMEIEPQYCDVIVRRWQKFTGKEAILEGTKKTFEKVVKERCKVS